MRDRRRLLILLLIMPFLSLEYGCKSERPADLPALYPATISLTYADGAPLVNAFVNLIPEDELSPAGKWSCTGTTDDKGTTALVTQGLYPGVIPSTYKVLVTCTVTEGVPEPPSPIDAESAKVYKQWESNPSKAKTWSVIALDYGMANKTPLTCTFKPERNSVVLQVGKQVREEVKPIPQPF